MLKRFAVFSMITAGLAGLSGTPALAGSISGWNLGNVHTTEPDAGGSGYSWIYDNSPTNTSEGSTSGYIKYTPDESTTPGLEVENQSPPSGSSDQYANGDVVNCIVASSDNSGCNSAFQSGKRFKLDRTGFAPIDLVFDLDLQHENDELYKVFQKYGNSTGVAIESFSIELGFGIGDAFVASTSGDGLAFKNFGENPKNNDFSSTFAAGLFGPGGTDKHSLAGYFSNQSAGFELRLDGEDKIQSAGQFGDYEALFGDWMAYSMAPDGYFFDDDGNPDTDAVLIAHYDEESGKWIMNRTLKKNEQGELIIVASQPSSDAYDSIEAVEQVLKGVDPSLSTCNYDTNTNTPCLAGVDTIEDLAKFNVTYFIDQIQLDETAEFDSFTLRVTAIETAPTPAPAPAPTSLALLGAGLFSFLGAARFRGRKK